MTKHWRKFLAAIAAIAIAVVLGFSFLGHQVPAGQPPLASLNANSVDAARTAFNVRPDRTRIILLLSPT